MAIAKRQGDQGLSNRRLVPKSRPSTVSFSLSPRYSGLVSLSPISRIALALAVSCGPESNTPQFYTLSLPDNSYPASAPLPTPQRQLWSPLQAFKLVEQLCNTHLRCNFDDNNNHEAYTRAMSTEFRLLDASVAICQRKSKNTLTRDQEVVGRVYLPLVSYCKQIDFFGRRTDVPSSLRNLEEARTTTRGRMPMCMCCLTLLAVTWLLGLAFGERGGMCVYLVLL